MRCQVQHDKRIVLGQIWVLSAFSGQVLVSAYYECVLTKFHVVKKHCDPPENSNVVSGR